MRSGMAPVNSLAVEASSVESEHRIRCGPQSHRSSARVIVTSGSSGAVSALSSLAGFTNKASNSRESKPVRDRSKSKPLRSSSSSARSSSSHSAHATDRLTISRDAFTCAGVHSSHRITGTSAMPSFFAPFRRRWPSTTSPLLRASTGILKPNSRMEAHIRSTAASFRRGFRA